jgi:2-iminobutanoate/2-iminopropanoate deaminase
MKKIIQSVNAPAPIGPYSQAVMSNNMLFASGQIAINPITGEIIDQNITDETHQVMQNIKAVLVAAEMNFHHIVKTTIFLSSMEDFAKVNEVYGSYFDTDYPARETLAVKTLPKNVNVEISFIAVLS